MTNKTEGEGLNPLLNLEFGLMAGAAIVRTSHDFNKEYVAKMMESAAKVIAEYRRKGATNE